MNDKAAPDRYELSFDVTPEMWERIQRARDLLRDEIPSGDVGLIFERAIDFLYQDLVEHK